MLDEPIWGGGWWEHRSVGPLDLSAGEQGWQCGAKGQYQKNDSEPLQEFPLWLNFSKAQSQRLQSLQGEAEGAAGVGVCLSPDSVALALNSVWWSHLTCIYFLIYFNWKIITILWWFFAIHWHESAIGALNTFITGDVCVQSQARLTCARNVCLFFLYIWPLSFVPILPSGRNLSPVISEFLPLSLGTTACRGVQDTSGHSLILDVISRHPHAVPFSCRWLLGQLSMCWKCLPSGLLQKSLSISDLEGFLHEFYWWYLYPGP